MAPPTKSYEDRNREEHLKIMHVLTETSVGIARIEANQEALSDKMDIMNENIQDHQKWIHGNGEPGAKTELDRLKQSDKRRKWREKTLLGLSGTAFVSVCCLLIRLLFIKS